LEESNLAGVVFGWAANVIAATLLEFVGLGGIFILFAVILYWLEKRTFDLLSQVFGYKAVIYSTGWIGTSAHELGHALMCLVFGHRITKLSLFRPDFDSGVMGSVNHSYNAKNLYQLVGNFFIGVAPLITGSALLVGAVLLLFPDYRNVLAANIEIQPENGYEVADFLDNLWSPVAETFGVVFDPGNFTTWEFWVFLCVAISISSHLAPSAKDMEGAWIGLGAALVPVLAINGIAVAAGWDFVTELVGLFRFVGATAGVFAVAVSFSLLGYLMSYLVSAIWYWLKYQTVLTPW
jgi:hypothetical protein